LDLEPKRLYTANKAIGKSLNIRFLNKDIRSVDVPGCDAIILYDVLHHMGAEQQEILIKQCFEKLSVGGKLYIKDVDPGKSLRFFVFVFMIDKLNKYLGINPSDTHCYRKPENVTRVLELNGFIVESGSLSITDITPHFFWIGTKA
jgi:2-polyprenyl-3-methyl-5-hydroxy-6-metoxy-1,4-benzoquinol methylase